MRGADERSGSLFSYIDLECRIPEAHPLRAIRAIVNAALADLNAAFDPRDAGASLGEPKELQAQKRRPGAAFGWQRRQRGG